MQACSRITGGSCARRSSVTAASKWTRKATVSSWHLPIRVAPSRRRATRRQRAPRIPGQAARAAVWGWASIPGEPLVADDHYVGVDVHRGARIAAAAHGGQGPVSERTRELVAEGTPAVWR